MAAEQTVFHRGDKGDNFYIILEGHVAVIVVIPIHGEFKQIEVAQLKKGDSFGEIALLEEGCVRTATIKTKENCSFAYLTKKDFKELI